MKKSAGFLLYRRAEGGIEVLIVHPSGNYNAKAAWSIPKGEVDEDDSLEDTARRETFEEVGITPPRYGIDLGSVIYPNKKKQVFCFASEVSPDTKAECKSWEIDKAEFVSLTESEQKLHKSMAEFIGRLRDHLNV